MSNDEILRVLKEIKEEISSLEDKLTPSKENQSDYNDPSGIPWQNRAMEYKRKLEALEKIQNDNK